jgi:hypothetical protein
VIRGGLEVVATAELDVVEQPFTVVLYRKDEPGAAIDDGLLAALTARFPNLSPPGARGDVRVQITSGSPIDAILVLERALDSIPAIGGWENKYQVACVRP